MELHYTTAGLSDPLSVEVSRSAELDLDPGSWSLRIEGSQHSVRSFTVALAPERAPLEVRVAARASPGAVEEPPAPTALAVSRPVTLRFSPERAVRRGITLKLQGPTNPGELVVRTPVRTMNLGPGAWTVTARARGYLPRAVEVGPEPAPEVEIRLAPDRVRQARIGVSIGMGAVGLAAIAGGTVGALVARSGYDDTKREILLDARNMQPQDDADSRRLENLTGLQAFWTGILGAGGGLGLTAVTVAAGGGRRSLIAYTAVGAGLIVVGGIGNASARSNYGEAKATPERFDSLRPPDLITTAVLSAGVGLAVGSLIALLTPVARSPRRRAHERLKMTSTGGGIALRGSF